MLPIETKIENGTFQSKSGTSVNLRNSECLLQASDVNVLTITLRPLSALVAGTNITFLMVLESEIPHKIVNLLFTIST